LPTRSVRRPRTIGFSWLWPKCLGRKVVGLDREQDGRWRVSPFVALADMVLGEKDVTGPHHECLAVRCSEFQRRPSDPEAYGTPLPDNAKAVRNQPQPSQEADVPLNTNGGVFVVPVKINGAITLDFAVDSGAADVTIPLDVFSTLKRTGTIKDSDILGQGTYVMADGSKSQSVRFKIRSLKVGDRVLENVTASVAPSGGMLLLGQSFLGRFKAWSIDNARHKLVLEPR
jgi:clan AA aspartic protease (TIGR02281 family)